MIKSKKNYIVTKLIFIVLISIIPFFVSDFSDDVTPEKITSDLRFYEINTCSISIGEFLFKNVNVIYQDHYRIVNNDYSSIKCFGTITGIDQINHVFYISVGTNPIISFFIQSILWLLILSLIRKSNRLQISLKNFITILISATFVTLSIFVESRFYEKKLYFFDLTLYKSYLYFFVFFLTMIFFQFFILENRKDNIINFLPFTFIFMQLYLGFNFYFLGIYFVTLGIKEFIESVKIRKLTSYILPIVFAWSYFALGQNYYLDPDKVRGSVSTIYNFISTSYFSFAFLFLILGIYKLVKKNKFTLNLTLFGRNILISSNIIIFLGYLSSSQPLFNFFNFFYFGLTKFGTRSQDYFSLNEWGEKLAWRGQFPSAETIGEFSALGLLIFLLYIIDQKILRIEKYKVELLLIPLSLFNLYLSNNRAAFVMLIFCIVLKMNKSFDFNNKYKAFFSLLLLIFLVFIFRLQNFTYSIGASSRKIMDDAILYSLDYNYSTSVQYFLKYFDENSPYPLFLLFIGQVGFLVNRSEIWSIFFARYNPNLFELLFGTGPSQLSNLYGEINIFEFKLYSGFPIAFLLPHSSFIIFIIYFGIVGLFIILFIWLYKIYISRKNNYDLYLINLFLFVNLIKSDSVLYIPAFIIYFVLVFSKKLQKKQ